MVREHKEFYINKALLGVSILKETVIAFMGIAMPFIIFLVVPEPGELLKVVHLMIPTALMFAWSLVSLKSVCAYLALLKGYDSVFSLKDDGLHFIKVSGVLICKTPFIPMSAIQRIGVMHQITGAFSEPLIKGVAIELSDMDFQDKEKLHSSFLKRLFMHYFIYVSSLRGEKLHDFRIDCFIPSFLYQDPVNEVIEQLNNRT